MLRDGAGLRNQRGSALIIDRMQHFPDMTGLLRSALRTKWLRGALVALLLFAQHGALTHALTHAARQAHGGFAQAAVPAHLLTQANSNAGGTPAKQLTELCAFDLVYSQVLGGVAVTVVDLPVVAATNEVPIQRTSARTVAEPPPFLAQGPPALI